VSGIFAHVTSDRVRSGPIRDSALHPRHDSPPERRGMNGKMALRVNSNILVVRSRSNQQPIAMHIRVVVVRGNSKYLSTTVYHCSPIIRIYEVLCVQELRKCLPEDSNDVNAITKKLARTEIEQVKLYYATLTGSLFIS
jgi:hypothetical protein